MEEDIEKCYDVLVKGGVILYPTDTVWGIGCDATNFTAIEKVFKIKQRKETKSLIILLDNIDKLKDYVEEIPVITYDFIKQYKNPLTIIYPKAKNLAENVIAKDGSIGIRIAKDDFCKKLISQFGKPIVSTSANLSQQATPFSFGKISEEIKTAVDYIVKYHQNFISSFKPSTIIKIGENGNYHVIRP